MCVCMHRHDSDGEGVSLCVSVCVCRVGEKGESDKKGLQNADEA